MVFRRLPLNLIALAALIASTGCRMGGTGNLAARPDSLAPRTSLTAIAALERHNRNAEQINSLEAKPSVSVSSTSGGAGLRGRMALEMPRNFDFELTGAGRDAAKIGSNDQGFWFWVNEKKDPAIYVCAYEDLSNANLTATMQPDWIIEALGLRPFTDEEMKTVASTPGPSQGTIWLTQRRKAENGEILTKKMLIDEQGRIREHRLYAGTSNTLLAQATVEEFKSFPIDGANQDEANPGASVTIPYRFKLKWEKENLALDMKMDGVKLNPAFNATRREALFTEPAIPGTPRVDLAHAGRAAQASNRGGVDSGAHQRRTTRPAPPAGGVELQDPVPLGVEGARRTKNDPIAFSADLNDPAPARDTLVRPEIPRPIER